MTLLSNALREGIRPFFSKAGMPVSAASAIGDWSRAYATYAQAAIAGGTLPPLLVPAPTAGPFFDALDQTLRLMWMAVIWTGPGLVGTTTSVPSLSPILRAVGVNLLGSRDPDQALSAITDALHTYTLGVTVTVTTAAGASLVVPVV